MSEDRAEENRLEAICASRRARAQERNALTLLSRHKPKRPEGTNSVVAASRTEERSSFYHVSREREGKGRGHDAEEANGAAKVGETDGGGESTEEGQIILTQDDTRQPPFPSGVATFVR